MRGIDEFLNLIYTMVYIIRRVAMNTAKIFRNGRSQAVRLPKEYRMFGKDVYVRKLDQMIILLPKKAPWDSLVKSLDRFSQDFMSKRSQPKLENRERLR